MTVKDGFKFGIGVIGAFLVVYAVALALLALPIIFGG
jgi:hypothetical protein